MEPKLKCPECGAVLDFTAIRRCAACNRIVCGVCRHILHKRSFCKKCWKETLDRLAREGMRISEVTV